MLTRRSPVMTLGFVVVLATSGCGTKAPPSVKSVAVASTYSVKVPSGPTAQQPPANPATDAPKFTLTAQAFYDEYTRSPQDARKKYEGKVIELNGVVKTIARNPNNQPLVYLQAGSALLGVMCMTVDDNPAAKMSVGQAVKLRGKWPEQCSTACLVDCIIVGR